MLGGILIAILPHLIEHLHHGTWSYIVDPDERLCYLPAISHSYAVHPWKLGDPALPTGGVSIYPWMQFVPAILLGKAIHIGPLGILFLLRIWAGASLGLISYLLGRELLGRALPALFVALMFLMDDGVTDGRPMDRTVVKLIELTRPASGLLSEEWVPYLRQYRLITPGNSWFFMGLFVLLLLRARRLETRSSTAWTAGAFGLLFYVYFYYWTAAGATLVLLCLFDRPRWRRYVAVGLGGALLGLPALLANSSAKHTQGEGWLQRLDLFLPVHHFDGILIPKVAWLYCLAAGAWIWHRHRDLLPLWCLGVSGLVLANHQLVTGLQIQNDHYIFIWGISIFLLVSILVVRALQSRFTGRGGLPAAAVVALAFYSASVICFRIKESNNNLEIVRTRTDLQTFRNDRREHAVFASNAVIAGDIGFTDFAVILDGQRALAGSLALSHSVNDTDWRRRRLLDQLVAGQSVDDASSQADSYYGCFWTSRRRSQTEMDAEFALRQTTARDLLQHLEKSLDHYQVQYIAVLRDRKTPVAGLASWHALPGGQRWQIWERNTPPR